MALVLVRGFQLSSSGFQIETWQSVIISREGLILTLSILSCPQGRIFWSTPCRKIDAERLSVLHQNSGGIGKSIPSALQISLDPWDFPRASPSGNLSGLGKSFRRRGWISQYLPRLGGTRIQSGFFSPVHWSRLPLTNSLGIMVRGREKGRRKISLMRDTQTDTYTESDILGDSGFSILIFNLGFWGFSILIFN